MQQQQQQFVNGFLREVRCEQYVAQFVSCGLVTPRDVAAVDREILVAMGVAHLGHRLRILRGVRLLKQLQYGQRDERVQGQVDTVVRQFAALGTGMDATGTAAASAAAGAAAVTAAAPSMASAAVFGEGAIGDELAGNMVVERHHVIFVLNDGSAKKVNVSGCFNAASIKRRLIRRLPSSLVATTGPESQQQQQQQQQAGSAATSEDKLYDVFVVDYTKNVLHLLYDVELVTICHSEDRQERNRLIFVSRDQTPSEQAILTSKKIFIRSVTGGNSALVGAPQMRPRLKIDNSEGKIRKIFDQRPPSEFISTNLVGYFPEADVKKLQTTLRESYRQSLRLSTASSSKRSISGESNKVGDILLKHSNAVDHALWQSLKRQPATTTTQQQKSQHSSPAAGTNATGSSDLFQLYDTESSPIHHGGHNESEEDDWNDNEDVVDLPTKIETPKSWLKGAMIGSGSFGSVYLGMNAQTGELMAVKQVGITPPPPGDTKATGGDSALDSTKKQTADKKQSHVYRKMVEALEHEMTLLKELHHENIVTYYGSSQESGNLNIFLEYVAGGSVSSMLNNYGPFEESLITNFTRQILIGVSYLHGKNIIHRDIKGANILIDIKGCVKITDFGISKKLSPLSKAKQGLPAGGAAAQGELAQNGSTSDKRTSLQGSVFWMAPEVVKQTATTEKADIWSTGCVVIEMFTGKHPFPDFLQMQAIFKIGTNVTPEIPSWASDAGKQFLRQAFELDYKRRPSAIELLQHEWLDTHLLQRGAGVLI
ncbi:mitogen-activated protein kinase kinase kinase STE11 KNAG_0B05880 [Huiozyma naganishii CBS 8797]|uniref:mitogen-activated protein kinase kinase kinase n=1 Tax=Huiozyma naganishii (strain ATCC MYA-139 / BCRC 22969 / CBS 8797 / KCTC 17520 / NBRC 10181 / NCYC 3082 / Yp74L-3) TaxID=1071383 RepID=J7S422_HUIN7|nr:hypothetical protein KNAG_0B05880 [Kazachstania naganishii CBS 8797]CCK69019.1 hypothetical protein KNAG_0B05880 [Kazachstania naganishii CBS 8797]